MIVNWCMSVRSKSKTPSSKAKKCLKEEGSSKVSNHLNEQTLSVVNENYPSESVLSTKKNRKEKISFRERNGAAYQVSEDNNLSLKRPDYYTQLQREISRDIKESQLKRSTCSSTMKRKSQWNRKFRREIEQDKKALESWFEHGVDSRATAPRYTPSHSETDRDTSDHYVNALRCRPNTLGDYIPPFGKSVKKEEMKCDAEDELEMTLSAEQCKNLRRILQDVKYRSQKVCKDFYMKAGEPYPGCCGYYNSSDSESESDSEVESPSTENEKLKKVIKCLISFSDVPRSHTSKVCAMGKFPLCKHGIRYQVNRCCETLFTEAINLLELIPERQLKYFSRSFKDLMASFDNLLSECADKSLVRCTSQYCRWNDIEIPSQYVRERLIYQSSPKNDLVAFEVKMAQVSSPYRQTNVATGVITDPSIDQKMESIAVSRYEKAVRTLDGVKSKLMPDRLDQLVNIIHRESMLLMESLPRKEASKLTLSISLFNEAVWRMKTAEEDKEELACCDSFYAMVRRRMRRTSISSSSEGEIPSNNVETEKLKVSDHPVIVKLDQSTNTETVNPNLSEEAETSKDNSSDPSLHLITASEGDPSPTWTYHVVDGTSKFQIFNNLGEAVSQSPKNAIVEMKLNSIKEESNSEIEIINKDDCVVPPVQISPTVTVEQSEPTWTYYIVGDDRETKVFKTLDEATKYRNHRIMMENCARSIAEDVKPAIDSIKKE